jgi:hypothetical protein
MFASAESLARLPLPPVSFSFPREKDAAGGQWAGLGEDGSGGNPRPDGNRYFRVSQDRGARPWPWNACGHGLWVYGGLGKKALNAINAVEREDSLRAPELASPAFIEAIQKAYRMADRGATTPSGKVLTDEQGEPIRLSAGEAGAQAMGFRPERMAQISGEHWPMENVKKHFAEKRNDLCARSRLAKTEEERQKVIRDMQRFNMEARKYRGVIPPVAASSLRQVSSQRPERPFMGFGKMMETSP